MIKYRYVKIELLPGGHLEMLGYIPDFLDEHDPDSAKEQIHKNYGHGGGWNKFEGFRYNPENDTLNYPEDPPLKPIAEILLHDERILIYPHAWVNIVQPDGSNEVARID
jgi:hypothetical protein